MSEEFEKQIFRSTWSEIKEHSKRDAIILIDRNIPLEYAAKIIVENDSQQVNEWIGQHTIGKPTQEQLDLWNKNDMTPFFFFIAQPYVLVQEILIQ